MANFFDIDQMLGDPNQDTTLTFRAKPLQAGSEKNVQPIQKTGEAAGGGETGKSFGDVITSPAVRGVLANVAIGLDPQGVGGTLGRGAKAQIESEQFNKVIAKMESGQEIEAADVIGLSPQAQRQAFDVIQAKGVAKRAEEQLGLQKAAAPGQRELVGARTAQITGAGEQALSEIDAKGKVAKELERLKQAGDANWREDRQLFADRVDYGVINQKTGERRSIAVGEPSPRDLGIFDQGGRRGETGKKITKVDLDIGKRAMQTTGAFKVIADKMKFGFGDIFGAQQAGGAATDPDKLANQLALTGVTNEKFIEVTGRAPTEKEIQDIAEINRVAMQHELHRLQTEFQPQIPGAGTTAREVQTPPITEESIQQMTFEQLEQAASRIPKDVRSSIEDYLNKTLLNEKPIGVSPKNIVLRYIRLGGKL